ncbi:MAG: hypothetical protein JJLCMIEE_00953 [Acidimicrobiales bacterium]|nr:hypothetical protein [Acidimicrobiales bacterium]
MSEAEAVGSGVVAEQDLRAADGRVPGRRGRATREKLLERTRQMLANTSYRDLKVVDIAREAGTSPATFYQYFPDVEAAILVLAERMSEDGTTRLPAFVRGRRWKGRAGYQTAEELVDGFLTFWEEYRPVIRVMEFATEEGEPRFRGIRSRLLNEFTVALSEVIGAEKVEGRHPDDLDPYATAGVLAAMLAQVAGHRYGFEFWGIRTDDLRLSMTRIVFSTVTGQRPPRES